MGLWTFVRIFCSMIHYEAFIKDFVFSEQTVKSSFRNAVLFAPALFNGKLFFFTMHSVTVLNVTPEIRMFSSFLHGVFNNSVYRWIPSFNFYIHAV